MITTDANAAIAGEARRGKCALARPVKCQPGWKLGAGLPRLSGERGRNPDKIDAPLQGQPAKVFLLRNPML